MGKRNFPHLFFILILNFTNSKLCLSFVKKPPIMEYVALGAAPGIAICIYFFYRDFYNKEPKLNLLISFILGGLAILPSIWLEGLPKDLLQKVLYYHSSTVIETAILSYGVIAAAEEFTKFLGLRFYSYRQKAFDDPFDGIVYAVIVSMGFATVENIMYVTNAAKSGMGLELGLKRMFLSVPAHATFGVIMGYFVGKAKFNSSNSFGLMLFGLLGAIFFHGTFDFFIFLNQNQLVNEGTSNSLIGGGAIASFVVSLVLCRRLIRNDRMLSRQMFKDNQPPHIPNV
jgi:RsiW-degrading membrane proteinase PrsW (M82 family)